MTAFRRLSAVTVRAVRRQTRTLEPARRSSETRPAGLYAGRYSPSVCRSILHQLRGELTDMGAACFAVLVHICVSIGQVSISASPSSILSTYEISGDGWKAAWETSDVIYGLNQSRMQQICRGTFCVFYYRKCNVPDAPTQCEFRFLLPRRPSDPIQGSLVPATPMRVTAEDADSMQQAMNRLSVIVDQATRTTISLLDMNREATEGDPRCTYSRRSLGAGKFEFVTQDGCPPRGKL